MERKNSSPHLPVNLAQIRVWTIIGPMGPKISPALSQFPILAVDGGAEFCDRMDVWIGDGDSNRSLLDCENVYRYGPIKDQSDLGLALGMFQGQKPLELHLWGFLGGRRDHEWINLGEVYHFLETKHEAVAHFYNSQGKLEVSVYSAGRQALSHQGTFSLATIKENQIQILGAVQYALTEKTTLLPLSSLGLSNSAHGIFEIIHEAPLMIIYPEYN